MRDAQTVKRIGGLGGNDRLEQEKERDTKESSFRFSLVIYGAKALNRMRSEFCLVVSLVNNTLLNTSSAAKSAFE